ncbi:MAG: hypothetical protein QUS14_16195 [Pyrinomonadaceae bacterium]|nr:hypothetical protein [Pyrinomonadaceae bacterium]
MRKFCSRGGAILGICFVVVFAAAIADVSAQTDPRTRTRTTRATPTPTPSANEPLIISRAEDFPDENAPANQPRTVTADPMQDPVETRRTIEALQARIKQLEASQKSDPDAKQRRLLLNLDILTRAEQRVEALRKQMFDMVDKEASVQTRLEAIEIESRPEMIERGVAFAGTLRPEELREAKARQLAAEKAKLQTLLLEVQKNKSSLEANILKAEDLVERLRTKLERDIDDALKDEDENKEPLDQ